MNTSTKFLPLQQQHRTYHRDERGNIKTNAMDEVSVAKDQTDKPEEARGGICLKTHARSSKENKERGAHTLGQEKEKNGVRLTTNTSIAAG
jgi:hypothetical protein